MRKLGWFGIGAGIAAGAALLGRKQLGGLLAVKQDGIQVPRSEKAWLDRVHRSNQLWSELGELASSRAEREAVRDFGSYLVGEHHKADYTLQLIARRMEIPIGKPIPSGRVELAEIAAQRANLAKLALLKGLEFDHAFLAVVLGEVDHAIDQLKLAAETFSSDEVGSLCKSLLPSLYVHRRKAYELSGLSAPDQEFLSTGDNPPVVRE